MLVALNAMLFSRDRSYRSGGISRVIHYLLAELARDPRGHRYDAYVPETPSYEALDWRESSLRFRAVGRGWERPSKRVPWEQLNLPLKLARRKPALLHSLAFVSPLLWPGPTVLTIYDLSFLRFPAAFKPGNRLYLSTLTRVSARRARRVITISEHSRQDIVDLLGVPREHIDVAYPAADARYKPLPPEEIDAFRGDKGLPEQFAFTVGTLEPRKNLAGLLSAYALIPEPERLPLYVAGGAGWQYTPLFERVQKLELERYVHFLGFVDEEELPLWYNSARFFAYPSLYEGFGLPVLEAMACGTPVITSNVSSIPEVAGRAAIMVPPRDEALLAESMRELAGADEEQLERLRAAGLEQAQSFSWRAMADETVRSYERAVRAA